ncbi:MAG: putative zinc-binding metallopeptidase [Prevotellaceae bacterium]|jgi:substrate import-associated zinc metallohydrolase lipoprotein|nr:putative zinc-binding metallopeptidase [Prevotellaceae bacterium]
MKRNLLYLFAAALLTLTGVACTEEPLSDISVIQDSQREENEFDRWITAHYTIPYNIEYKYRMEDIESDMNYNLIPADYIKAKQLALLTIHLCLGAYDEVTGSRAFIAENFPKMIHVIGSPAVRNDGSIVLGTAEGGQKISLYSTNYLRLDSIQFLNYWYFHTMHHEFGHILNQKKPYSADFKALSAKDYRSDSWISLAVNEDDALKLGFITAYASSEPGEDFVELISVYVTETQEQWEERLRKAMPDNPDDEINGKDLIEAKFEIVYNYMLDSWNIDLTALRETVQQRQATINTLDFNF